MTSVKVLASPTCTISVSMRVYQACPHLRYAWLHTLLYGIWIPVEATDARPSTKLVGTPRQRWEEEITSSWVGRYQSRLFVAPGLHGGPWSTQIPVGAPEERCLPEGELVSDTAQLTQWIVPLLNDSPVFGNQYRITIDIIPIWYNCLDTNNWK